eukprot:CAMPEP_0185162816 /NCGR_PEP_ID=MMETSP1139-20130426/7076_1 /TAXON_ID=298111 /ORGANISM="Pavlova sp., Strain CCMP459" /LENGTH=212 /DNA_ID=CAMNT_0027728155 /DNA_START=520 /DNA_END=1156 /DNA_ORIENTATION=+
MTSTSSQPKSRDVRLACHRLTSLPSRRGAHCHHSELAQDARLVIRRDTPSHLSPSRASVDKAWSLALLLGHADRAALAASGLCVLATHAQAPVVAKTPVCADLLEALQVLAELEVEVVGANLGELAILVVLLPVQEPVRDLELARVLDDGHDTLHLFCGQLTRTLLKVHLRLLEHHVREATAHTADASQCEHHLLPTINVGVQHTQDVLEVS